MRSTVCQGTYEQGPERNEVSQPGICLGRRQLKQRKHKFKGLEAVACLMCLRNPETSSTEQSEQVRE